MTTDTAHAGIDVEVPAPPVLLPGWLTLPRAGMGLVLFAHGSNSTRRSPRNQFVASMLHDAGLGTLLFDLLAETETEDRDNVFNIELLARRLLGATRWVLGDPRTVRAPIGLFGASTGAGAALVAAAQEPLVRAVVSRGGRPDLAGTWLERVTAPTLLIVGGEDRAVLELNRQALGELRCTKHMAVVPGATHLFEEPGTLEQAAQLATDWFTRHLRTGEPT